MGDRGAIYVSGIDAARSLTTLKRIIQINLDHQIGAILSVARGGLVSHQKQDIPHYLYIPADDHESFDLQKSFEDAYKFIDMARKKTNILIHCMAGISRSATITAAYLIKKFGNKTINVIEHLQRKRKRVKC
jgi:dual specificity phosphatase 12